MSLWGSRKARVVYRALLHIGWQLKPSKKGSSHVQLVREGWPEYTWSFGDDEELGRKILSRIAKHTGLRPEDL